MNIGLCFGQIDSLEKVFQNRNTNDTIRIQAAIDLAYEFFESSPDTAFIYCSKALPIAEKLKNKKWVAAIKRSMASAYIYKGMYEKSLVYANEALIIYKRLKDITGLAKVNSTMAQIYESTGNLDKSLKCWIENYKYNLKLNNEEAVARACMNIGVVYKNLEEYDLALKYLDKALKIAKKLNHQIGLAACNTTIGIIYEKLKKFDKALSYYKQSLKITKESGNKHGEGAALANISSVYSQTGQNQFALEFQRQSLKIEEELGNIEGMAISYGSLGIIYRDMGSPKLAEEFFVKGLKLAVESNNNVLERDIHQFLFDFYKKKQNTSKALFHLEEYLSLKDSIINVEKKTEAAKSEMKFQYELERQSDSVFHAKNEEIADAKLKAKDAEVKQQRLQKFSLWGGLAIIAIFTLFLFNRFRIIKQQNKIIEEQKLQVVEKNKEITDSINYAQKIQHSLLPAIDDIKNSFTEAFVFFQPKDIVSGDFYWIGNSPVDHSTFVAIADCTGHGVPGAFMSMLGMNLLNDAIIEQGYVCPAKILDFIREQIIKSLKQTGREGENKDGMDIVLMKFSDNNSKLTVSGAHNGMYICNENEMIEVKTDKMPIGFYHRMKNFTKKEFDIKPGYCIYAFTDGFPDQFGGPNGKKYKYSRLEKYILTNYKSPMKTQFERFRTEFFDWKNEYLQNDDVCLIGIKV